MAEIKKKKRQYVDNEKFYAEMKKYKIEYNAAMEEGKEKPRMNDYIGKCISDISNHLSRNHNFINYPIREEMIFDGIENAVKAAGNFDYENYKNPFSYFTTIIYYAFLRRIAVEKKELYVKQKMLMSATILNEGSGSTVTDKISNSGSEYMNDFVESYEAALEKKKLKLPKNNVVGIEKFTE